MRSAPCARIVSNIASAFGVAVDRVLQLGAGVADGRRRSTKIVGMPALISVALNVPTPGTSSSSTTLPVGNIAPPPSPSPRRPGRGIRAAPRPPGTSRHRARSRPFPAPAPSVIGTCATMVLPMLACQMRTTADAVARNARGIDEPVGDRERADRRGQVAAVAAPVDEGLVDRRPGRTGSRRRGRAACSSTRSPSCWCSTWRRPCRRSACRTGRGCRSRASAARRARRRARCAAAGRSSQAEEHALAGAAAHVGGGDPDLRNVGHGRSVFVRRPRRSTARKSCAKRCSTPPAS